jgi:tetratricopeptide (TPR) repeat protein
MAALSSKHWVAISGSVILFASLFFVNRKAPAVSNQPPMAAGHATAGDFNVVLEEAEKQVPADKATAISKLNAALATATPEEKLTLLKTIIDAYDSLGAEIPGTYYIEKLAGLRSSADLWYKAADRYYTASEIGDQQARATLIQKALQCYKSSFAIDSTNLDTRVGIGKCLVEGSPAPMQGIAMIEGVLKKDSNNLNGQLALGELSVQSGQFPKAIYRFNRVLTIKPSFSDAYLYLADVYEKTGNKQEAVSCLKKYSTFVTDKKIEGEVNNEIKRLQNDTLINK